MYYKEIPLNRENKSGRRATPDCGGARGQKARRRNGLMGGGSLLLEGRKRKGRSACSSQRTILGRKLLHFKKA